MATLTWKGEEGSEDTIVWKGITFKKGEAVECNDPVMYDKAKNNVYFDVDGERPEPPDDTPIYPSAVDVSSQRPVPKPGEPIPTEPITPAVTPVTQKWPKL